jgi:hypothetical protein
VHLIITSLGELSEGLVEIGEQSFAYCSHSITRINTPASLRRICDDAFRGALRCHIHLNDGIESIGGGALIGCIFTNFRIPPLITTISESMLNGCNSIFSVEFPDHVTEIGRYAFFNCQCLRNIAFPENAAVLYYIIFFKEGSDRSDSFTDLQLLFDSNATIIRELKHRFDGLPIHKLFYYQTYNQGMLVVLRRLLDSTGNDQDCLGMTPLHILACSSVHDLEVYRVIVEKHPTNLITEDRWGALPLLYAFWGAAPAEIIQFLVDSYQLLYPDHVFNWTAMAETMGRCDTPKENIENLLGVKQMHFPEQLMDWDYLLDKFAQPSDFSSLTCFQERMQLSCAACQPMLRILPLKFGVIK